MNQLGPGGTSQNPGLKGEDSHRCFKLWCSADPETEEQEEALIESKLSKKRGGKEKAHRIYNHIRLQVTGIHGFFCGKRPSQHVKGGSAEDTISG